MFILPVNYTIDQLRAATKTQIITAISNYLTNNFTKRQIVIWLLNNTDVLANDPVRTYNPDGQIASEMDVDVDAETGLQVDGKTVTWTYYPTGEVDEITIQTLDATGTVTQTKTIKHYISVTRQPTVTVVDAPKQFMAQEASQPKSFWQKAVAFVKGVFGA